MKLSPLYYLGVEIPFFLTPGVKMFIRIDMHKFYQKYFFLYILHYQTSKYGYLPHHRYLKTKLVCLSAILQTVTVNLFQ